MKPTTTLALSITLTTAAALLPPALSPAEEKGNVAPEIQQRAEADPEEIRGISPEVFAGLLKPETLEVDLTPPAPTVPEGTKMTPEIKSTIALITARLIDPVRNFSNRRALMSRAFVRMDTHYAFAITDTSESLFPFDVYQRHRSGEWTKVASGVCHPGMESLKVAHPDTGVMIEPIKHPLFAAALTELKRAEAAAS